MDNVGIAVESLDEAISFFIITISHSFFRFAELL
jgi:hypothetical protein